MTEHEQELLEGLRQLASEAPREAPARVEARLLWEFSRRQRQRRWMVWLPVGSAAAVAVAVLLLFGMSQESPKPAPAAAAALADDDADTGFYPLPEAEALPPVENSMVVLVQVPVASLRLMGVPVAEERAGAVVQADVLLGQDGLARAVRLVE